MSPQHFELFLSCKRIEIRLWEKLGLIENHVNREETALQTRCP
jgi:hypothetical protein